MTGRPPLDLRLYLVTDPVLVGDLGVAGTVAAAAAAGVTVVQLRDPDADDDGFVATGRQVRAALAGTGIPLVVNDRVHLVEAIGADGAHVGQGDLDAATARRMLGPEAYLGLSVQTLDHVEAALRQPEADLDYLGVGPVWAQQTKPDAAEPGGTDLLAAIVRRSPWPCVAIGGIDGDRVAQVRRTGAAGVAVVSAICGRPDVAAATRALLGIWESAAAEAAP